jgi:ABC-type multidrug transport system ATPase subunit
VIGADRLSKRFGPVRAVEGVSFNLAPGRVVGVLGSKGSVRRFALPRDLT